MPSTKLRELRSRNGSAQLTFPKSYLRADGLVDEDGEPTGGAVALKRVGPKEYDLRVLDPEDEL